MSQQSNAKYMKKLCIALTIFCMNWRRILATLMGLLLIFAGSSVSAKADSQLTVKIIKAGDGTSTVSTNLTIHIEISGSNSATALSCAQYLSQNKNIRIGLTANSLEGSKVNPIDVFTVKTLSISPTTLNCEFSAVPNDYFGGTWKFASSQVDLIIKIYSGNSILDQKNLKMTDLSSMKPKLTILSPLRASEVPGDFVLTTSIQNSAYWNVKSTYIGVGIGTNFLSCNGLVDAGTQIKNLDFPTRFNGANGFIVTQRSSTTFRFQFLIPGQYTLCVYQYFRSVAEPTVEALAEVIGFAKVTSPVPSLTLNYNDPILESGSYQIDFSCPATISSKDGYTCTLQAVQKDIRFAYYNQGFKPSLGTKISLTGTIPVVVCEFSNDVYRGMGCGVGAEPPYFAKTQTVLVGFDKPVAIKVNNYLSKTGFTGVEIDRSSAGKETYAWKAYGYDAKKKKATNAPPSVEFQSSLVKALRGSMKTNCQKLPANFTRLPMKFSKRITSRDGIPGYLFVINNNTNLQVYDMGNAWQYGPSIASSDQKTWKSWGCGTAIWIY
jgi:hypothetical protein